MKLTDYHTMQGLIAQNFTLDELGVVCDTLGVNIDKILGNGVIAKAYGIVPYMAERGRIRDLFNALCSLKPAAFSEYRLDERRFRLPIESGFPSLDTDLALIEVPPDQAGTRVVQLEASDPQAELLIKQIEELQDRIVVLADPIIQQRAYETLEEAARLLRANPENVDDWQLQMTLAEFLIRKTAAAVYRAERSQERRRAEISSIIEYERTRALDERRITWLVPLITLGYAILVAILTLYAFRYAGEDYIIPVLGLPLQILVWSSIGSLSALLFRYYKRERTSALISEIRLLIGRFWIGIVAGSVFYFAMRSGLFVLSNQVVDLNNVPPGQQPVLWVLVWLIAFSDFMFERVIARISGNLIGEEADKAITSVLRVTTSEIADMIERAGNEQLAELRRLRAEFEAARSNGTTAASFAEPVEAPAEDRVPLEESTSEGLTSSESEHP